MNEMFNDLEMPEKNKKRAKRRKNDYAKAVRKKKLDEEIHRNLSPWYNNLHEYSKNEIHCSCQMCRFRSGWYPDEKPASDIRKEIAASYEIKENLK